MSVILVFQANTPRIEQDRYSLCTLAAHWGADEVKIVSTHGTFIQRDMALERVLWDKNGRRLMQGADPEPIKQKGKIPYPNPAEDMQNRHNINLTGNFDFEDAMLEIPESYRKYFVITDKIAKGNDLIYSTLSEFRHPENCAYIFGGQNQKEYWDNIANNDFEEWLAVEADGHGGFFPEILAGIVLHDRYIKQNAQRDLVMLQESPPPNAY